MSTADVASIATFSTEPTSREASYEPSTNHANDAPSTHPNSREASLVPETATHQQETPQSQPMTATASNSSLNPSPENADASGSGPYGTRSRNRAGGPRPNYAEDKELDMEIEASGRYPKVNLKKISTTASGANSSSAVEAVSGSTPFAAIDSTTLAVNDSQSETAASGSTSAAPTTSKKRKQPGSNITVSTATVNGVSSYRSKNSTSNHARQYVETNMMSFDRCKSRLNARKQLVGDDGTILSTNDHAYFVCEPPGEPYYLARIMEFLHVKNDPSAPIDAVRVNWYYRPKDILRRVQDTRVVFASMHSDTCPLTSIRGKCNIQHLSEIASLDDYRLQKDCFWFDKLYDRYMLRYYEVIPTGKVVNVPQHVKKVLDERWKYVLVEIGRGRELTAESKKCKKCEQFAANNDSVGCAVCKNTYHMFCVKPPLQKKPARGFAWACAACSRAQELKLEARHTPAMSESAQAAEDEMMEEEEDEEPTEDHQETRESSVVPEPHQPPTAAQIAQANLWPYRYLGVHSRVEDALDYDDRIYPRASSRLGPRHQANVNVWHGRPVQLVKPSEIKKKYLKNTGVTKKDTKLSKEASAAIEADRDQRSKRPKWVVDEPVGYISRGHDEPVEIKGKKDFTAQLTFRMPDPSKFTDRGNDEDDSTLALSEDLIDKYMKEVKLIAPQYGVSDCSTDFLTKAVEKLQENDYDYVKALDAMKHLSLRTDLKQPDLNREEVKRFEEGVAKYGSELHAVARHVGSNFKESRIVRYYYMWKKTDRGRQIWGSFEGRKSKKESKRVDKDNSGSKLIDDVADDVDDSAFDSEKALQQKRGFECKFCLTRSSRQWRRAPGTAPGTLVPRDPAAKTSKDKSTWLTMALCGRCAYLWRRYAIQYESIEEVSKKIAASAGRATKRKIDEELMRTIFEAQHESGDMISTQLAHEVNKSGMEVPQSIVQPEEPIKKKIKAEKDANTGTPEVVPPPVEKKKVVQEKAVELPLDPEPPRVKVHPCAVCQVIDLSGQELLKCRDCRLHVHGSCYGVGSHTNTKPWFCDMCQNDHNLQVSTIYDCVLCPVKYTAQELMEPLRTTHKKKSDRDREKERLEREMIIEAGRRWRQEQEAAGRPVNPREALKRTAGNNWIHITCALWTKEIKFGNAELLDDAEGVGFIPLERYEAGCKICKESGLPTVKCHLPSCNIHFHVGCAHQAGYIFGFDVSLVKGSRRDSVNVMKLDQETGLVTAAIWCSTHLPPTYVHNMLELTDNGLTAMQLFARTYKQADQSVTGTVRRAAQFTTNVPSLPLTAQSNPRRNSKMNGTSTTFDKTINRSREASPLASPTNLDDDDDHTMSDPNDVQMKKAEQSLKGSKMSKKCCTCDIEFSPKWWTMHQSVPVKSYNFPSPNGNGKDIAVDHHSKFNPSQPNIPPPLHTRTGSLDRFRDTVMANGAGYIDHKTPAEKLPASGFGGDHLYQCHKCHVEERVPPSSPSHEKVRRRSRHDPIQDSLSFQPQHGPPPPAYSSRHQLDGPIHSHPMGSAMMPPHNPWPTAPPQWSSPVIRNGGHSQPPGPLPHQAPPPPPPGGNYYAANGPPPIPDYSRGYSGRPPYPSSYSTVPPPSHPPAHGNMPQAPPNGLLQHSFTPNGIPPHRPPPNVMPQHPPTHRGPPHHSPPQPSRYSLQPPPLPPPPPGQQNTGPVSQPPASPRGLAHPPMPPRQYPPEPSRPGSMESQINGYVPPQQAPRLYNQAPPQGRPSSSHAQSLVQIAQAATEHTARPHSRQPSVEGTPRLGPPASIAGSRFPESPNQRPMTPAGDATRDENRMGPGASASPRIHNLLT